MTEVVAGWYPDPAGGPTPRWWDGQEWTDSVQPISIDAGETALQQTSSWPYHSALNVPAE